MLAPASQSLRTWILSGVATAAIAGTLFRSHADPTPPAPPHTPLLQQLSAETQGLYTTSRHSMVRVQLPTPQWLEEYNRRQNAGTMLDPQLREKYQEDQEKAAKAAHGAPSTQTIAPPTTASSTQPFAVKIQVTDAPRGPASPLALFAMGVLVDQQGHAVFPVYVDKKTVGDAPLQAVTGDGESTTAKFVGSDMATNLTVLQLEKRVGVPTALGHSRPDDGVLALSIAADGGARLIVWNNQHTEPGFAFLTDGALAGFGFDGQFLGASQAKPIVEQLINTGVVHRAVLGVLTQAVGKEDPVRRQHPQLGNSPAIRIIRVRQDSAASQGGIQADDLILKIGDEPVGDAPTFAAVIASKNGATVLHLLRGEKLTDVTVNLEAK